jgi:hypothetical protein
MAMFCHKCAFHIVGHLHDAQKCPSLFVCVCPFRANGSLRLPWQPAGLLIKHDFDCESCFIRGSKQIGSKRTDRRSVFYPLRKGQSLSCLRYMKSKKFFLRL